LSLEKLHEAMQRRERRTVNERTGLIQLNGKLYQASQNLAGKRLQIRWPFDDESAVFIWQDGGFCERAPLFIPAADIDYSKRPQRQKKEEGPKVLDCSKRLRLSLVAKYRSEKPPESTSQYGILSQREFIYVVEQCLGKSLDEVEAGLLSQSYMRLYPLDAEFVQHCMSKAIANKGARRHLSFYLDQLEEMRKHKR